MLKNKKKLVLIGLFLVAVVLFYTLGLHNNFTLEYMQASLGKFRAFDSEQPFVSKIIFFSIYVGVVALSLPGATLMTLLAGALFGAVKGTVLVSFASSIGASLAFLSARYILRDAVQGKFGEKLKAINEGLEKDGVFYLFSLRLIPLFPFFLINILMGLTKIRLWTFYWVSQVGMLAGTFVYVQAGEQLSKIQSLKDVGNPKLLLAFTLIGLLPLLFKSVLGAVRSRKVYKDFKRPKKYEYNTVVIGAGAAGLVSSYISAAVKAKVALIEKDKMGGDCLNYGCVPSKAIIKSSKVMHAVNVSRNYGIAAMGRVDFKEIMARVHKIIAEVEPHDSVARYTGLGVECFRGAAKILSPFEVEVNGRVLTTKNIIIAAGAEPVIPKIKGIESCSPFTSENIWKLTELPEKLVIVGGGAIGCELAQCFQRLGSKVTLIERGPLLLARSDQRASTAIAETLKNEGVRIVTGSEVHEIEANAVKTKYESFAFTHILFALGRRARSENSGFEALALELNPDGTLAHNEFLQTRFPNVYVCGDVAGPIQLTHMASHQAWYASVNALFSPFKKFKTDYSVIPSVVFTDPEVAQVGLTEAQAQSSKIEIETVTYEMDDLDRAICEGEKNGFIKIVTKKGSDKILGATLVGAHAGELIAEITLAMRWNLGLNKILGTVHSYPTWSEALKMTAGRWKQVHKPEGLLKVVEKYHSLRRGSLK